MPSGRVAARALTPVSGDMLLITGAFTAVGGPADGHAGGASVAGSWRG
jgi:hypothetical protein